MYRFQEKPKDKSPHPIWRGIGCILVVVILMMSYATADLLIQENFHQGWVVLPPYLNLPLSIPSVSIPSVGTTPAINISYFFANLTVTLVLALMLFTIISIIYSIFYRASGGGRPGPMDAAQIKRRWKQRKLRRE